MNNLTPKSQILSLVEPVPARYQSRIKQSDDVVVKKVQQINEILTGNQALIKDADLIGGILKFTEKNADQTINDFRKELIYHYCCNVEDGIIKIKKSDLITDEELAIAIQSCPHTMGRFYGNEGKFIISQNALKKYVDEFGEKKFWDFIKDQWVKELEITQENGDSIFYSGITLKKLVDEECSVEDLYETYTLEFELGELFMEAKAKLRLCGDFFEAKFSADMNGNDIKRIYMGGVTLNGFCEVLNKVETGKDPVNPSDEYTNAVKFLQLSRVSSVSKLPEGVLGAVEWNKCFGDPGRVPAPSQEFLEYWNTYCNAKTHMGVYVPAFLDGKKMMTIDEMASRAQSPKFGKSTIVDISVHVADLIRKKPVKEGYWLVMEKIPQKLGGEEASHKAYCAEKGPECDLPNTIDVIICSLMLYANTGEFLFGRNPWRFVRCHEQIGKGNVVVGGFNNLGLLVLYDDVIVSVGVVCARKFPPKS